MNRKTDGRDFRDSSYPTYEEWKPCMENLDKSQPIHGSYPTYEEWKQFCHANTSSFINLSVLILPMRNGNDVANLDIENHDSRSYPTYEEWKLLSSSASGF